MMNGGYCEHCGRTFYPERKYTCPYCGSNEMKRIKLPERGRIISYAVKKDKDAVAVVELSNGCRIIGVVKGDRIKRNVKIYKNEEGIIEILKEFDLLEQ
jgi:Predicted nucleic-acid-binding protein containing a Zn-ribbon